MSLLVWVSMGEGGLSLIPAEAAGQDPYYVSMDGNNSNPGTLEQPFRSIRVALLRAKPGVTIYVRAGTYVEAISIDVSGTEQAPITLAGYLDERPIIDGQGVLPDAKGDFAPLVDINADHIVFRGFEIMNSAGRGVAVRGAKDVQLSELDVHHNWKDGIKVTDSSSVLVEDSKIWQNVQARKQANIIGGHGFGFVSVQDGVARRNQVYNNYGEGLAAGRRSENILLEDNVLWDNMHASLYLLNTRNSVARRNLVYCTDDREFWVAPQGPLRASNGLVLNDETFRTDPDVPVSEGRIVVNNILVGCGVNLAVFSQHNNAGLKNAVIAHNTIVEAAGTSPDNIRGLHIAPGNHVNTLIANNIVLQTVGNAVSGNGAADPELHFSHNVYSQSVPSDFRGEGDVIANPLLANPQALRIPGAVDPMWYQLKVFSPAREAGLPLPLVSTDFFGKARLGKPDAGAIESSFVPAAVPMDINLDGRLDVLDVQLCVNIFLGVEASPDVIDRADVNGDGSVNVLDVQSIVNSFLQG